MSDYTEAEEKELAELRAKGLQSLSDRIDRLKAQGASKEGITFDIDQVMAKTALSSLMFGTNIRAVIAEMNIVLAEADKLIGAVEG